MHWVLKTVVRDLPQQTDGFWARSRILWSFVMLVLLPSQLGEMSAALRSWVKSHMGILICPFRA